MTFRFSVPTAFVIPALLFALSASSLGASPLGESMAANLADVEEKVIGLAEAIPDGKYGWSPSDGVRSVGAVLAHVAAANYFFASRMGGGKPPEDVGEWEKTWASQADAVEKVKASFAAVREALANADLAKATKLFGGRDGTLADLALIAVGHGHEHLGQLIAYARSNEIAPPWSQ